VRLVLCCGFVDEETQFIVKLCCLKVEVCATTHAIFAKLKQIIEENMVLIRRSISQLLSMEQQPWKVLLNELCEKSKTFFVTVLQPVFMVIFRS